MATSGFETELHVAQQSRRDKLRIMGSVGNFSVNSMRNPDSVHARGVTTSHGPNSHDFPIVASSQYSNFHETGHGNPSSKFLPTDENNAVVANNSPCSISSDFDHIPKVIGAPQIGYDDNSKGIAPQEYSGDWMLNHNSSGLLASEINHSNPTCVGEVMSNNVKIDGGFVASTPHMRGNYNNRYHDLVPSINNQSDFPTLLPSHLYREALHGVSSDMEEAQTAFKVSSMRHGVWTDAGSELALLPAHGSQIGNVGCNNSGVWRNDCHQWRDELGNVSKDANLQGLSLSLSSNATYRMDVNQFGDKYAAHEDLHSSSITKDPMVQMDSCPHNSFVKPSLIGNTKLSGKSLQDVTGIPSYSWRSTGPLGPFTGYAAILKSSKFLKPAQQLLDEFCCIVHKTDNETCDMPGQKSKNIAGLADAVRASENENRVECNIPSPVSSSALYSSSDLPCEDVGVVSSSSDFYQPPYHQKKAKLLFMQEEVCRRYKQYHQQMQMVVASFESVAGLSAASPYISSALKTVSRNFRCLKNAISDYLRHVKKILGEDSSTPGHVESSSKDEINSMALKGMNQSFQRPKHCGVNICFHDNQHVWRPQRGLPERSVAILRAWLFEHFLHPYPTDADKHMLAAQTGLTRNQVSNWFINARVRVWKPMVEEIHMLETKAVAGQSQNSSKNPGKESSQMDKDLPSHRSGMISASDGHMEGYGTGSSSLGPGHAMDVDEWNQDKRSRAGCRLSTDAADQSLISFMPYQGSVHDLARRGAVSLTLGLRQEEESRQHQWHQVRRPEHQLRQQYGGQMVHDLVG